MENKKIKLWDGNKVGIACNVPSKCAMLKDGKCTLEDFIICRNEELRKDKLQKNKKRIKATRKRNVLDARSFKLADI